MNSIDAMKAYYEAKTQGGIVPYFQPIVSVNDHQMLAAEVLCRIKLPDGSIITPDQFIPILEKTGEICDLDWYIAERACQMALSTEVECDQKIKFSVNMSRRHAYEWDAAEHLLAIADRYMVAPGRIIVEITEGYSVEDYLLNHMMDSLQEAGFSVAFDDFGEGYATLGSLKEASFDVIKIDRSIVGGDFTNDNAGAIIQSIVKLAQDLGVKVIGEGAETYEQLLFYIRCGCEYAQGNIYGKPLCEEHFLQMLNGDDEEEGENDEVKFVVLMDKRRDSDAGGEQPEDGGVSGKSSKAHRRDTEKSYHCLSPGSGKYGSV